MSAFGSNTSSQACWPLHKCIINQRLLQAAPHSCVMCVVCHFPQDDQVSQFLAAFFSNFLFIFVFSCYEKFPNQSLSTVAF